MAHRVTTVLRVATSVAAAIAVVTVAPTPVSSAPALEVSPQVGAPGD